MREALTTHRWFLLVAVIVTAAIGTALAVTQRAYATNSYSCWRKSDCRCFGGSYCTDWPVGQPCKSTNDCGPPLHW